MNKLAVVILNYNDYDNLIRYTNSIKNYKCIYKIIIVDNSLNEIKFNEISKLTSEKIDVIKTPKNGGYAYGNNFAIEYMNNKYNDIDYIAISNPDVEVPVESYKACVELLDTNKDIAIVSPRMFDINKNPHPLAGWRLRTVNGDIRDSSEIIQRMLKRAHTEIYNSDYFNTDISYVDCLPGSFFIIKNSVFNEIGYFDSNTFLYYEEDIIGSKLKKLGYKAAVINNCHFIHYEAVSVNRSMKYIKKYKNMQKSKKYFHKKYNNMSFIKSILFSLVTLLGIIEIYYNSLKNKINIIKIIKAMLYAYTYLTLPIYLFIKKIRPKKHILYFSIVSWKWIKQRPHFVPYEISKYNKYKVDYRYQTLKDNFLDLEDIQLVKNKLDNNHNLSIKPFKIYPSIKKYILIDEIINLVKTSMLNYDTVILTQPNQLRFFILNLLKIRKVKIIYECMDNYNFWENDKDLFHERENRLINYSSNIIVTSNKLKEILLNKYNIQNDKIIVIRNAYDKVTFENIDDELKLKHPNLTYIGTIDDWFDFDSIINYSKCNTDKYIYIIGPMSKELLSKSEKISKEYSNIFFTGPIEHDLVPSYINESDVLILPFILNRLIEAVDPVKLYEYLYLKKPVVSSYWNELEQFKNLVYFYDVLGNNFGQVVDDAIKGGFIEDKSYKSVVLDATWENRVKDYIDIL